MYCLAKWNSNGEEGLRPCLPNVEGFGVLAGHGGVGTWTLCHVHIDPSCAAAAALRSVSVETASLLKSCEGCPVPVALAASAMKRTPGVCDDCDRFEQALCRLLRFFLDLRDRGLFIPTKSRVEDLGYRNLGERVWAVNRRGAMITWVSNDYRLYTDAAEQFDLSAEELDRLPERVPLPVWVGDVPQKNP